MTDLTARLDADAAHAQRIQARAKFIARTTARPDTAWLLARLAERDAALRAVLDACDLAESEGHYAAWEPIRAAVVSALSGGAE